MATTTFRSINLTSSDSDCSPRSQPHSNRNMQQQPKAKAARTNVQSSQQFAIKKRSLPPLRPAPAKKPEWTPRITFYDLPAELRNEIYNLALADTTIHVLPEEKMPKDSSPPSLTLTSRQVRDEVLPLIHSRCSFRTKVEDLDFSGLLEWLSRIPPNEQRHLTKNKDLRVEICWSTAKPGAPVKDAAAPPLSTANTTTLRSWLHDRADPCRPQPEWLYCGEKPKGKIASDLRRRHKRMTEPGKKEVLRTIMEAVNVK